MPDLAFLISRRFVLRLFVSVCQIVVPFNPSKHIHHILLCAKGRNDLFTLRQAVLRQSSSSETIFSRLHSNARNHQLAQAGALLACLGHCHTLSWGHGTCSTSSPSGNQVDGSQLVAKSELLESNTGEGVIGLSFAW